jgi:vacuolar-type H+-ATPase catalytic subunit A/Vma1
MKEDNNEYEEKLSDQIEQISKCINKDNLSDKEKIECVINTFLGKKRYQKNTFSKKVISKNTFSKKVISKTSKTSKTKTQKKMNNNVPRVTQNKEIKPEDIPITINTIGLYINSIKNK